MKHLLVLILLFFGFELFAQESRQILEGKVNADGTVTQTRTIPYSINDADEPPATTPPAPPAEADTPTEPPTLPPGDVEGDDPPTLPPDIFIEDMKARVGTENRIDMNGYAYPNSAVARLTFSFGGQNFSCTAFRVSRRIVMTNGHCVYDLASKTWHSNFLLKFGFNNGLLVQQAAPITMAVSTFYTQGVAGVDWALLILPANVPNATGWFGTKDYNAGWNNSNFWYINQYASNVVSHPFNSNFQTRNQFAGSILQMAYSNRTLFYGIDTGQGASGSPIWSTWLEAGKYNPYVVGLNYAGWGPRDAQRMNSCSPTNFGSCGNLGTARQVFAASLINYINAYPN